jgi:hypothetical protein
MPWPAIQESFRRGLTPASLYTRGYWQLGKANRPDHEFGEDVTRLPGQD